MASSHSVGFVRLSILGLALSLLGPVSAQTRYPAERDNSPVTPQVAARIRSIFQAGQALPEASRPNRKRFIKVGDSITANSNFLSQFVCLDDVPGQYASWEWVRNLGDWKPLLLEATDFYRSEIVPGDNAISDAWVGTTDNHYPVTSYNRVSKAAQVGAAAGWSITPDAGDPSGRTPLQQEIEAIRPAFAFIMFGTNHFGGVGTDWEILSSTLAQDLAIADACVANGVVPVLSAPLQHDGDAQTIRRSRLFSHLLRAAMQGRALPFVNCYRALMPLPNHGHFEGDVHPNLYDYDRTAWFTPEALHFGHNMRNLITLTALNQVYQVLEKGADSVAPEALPALTGTGTSADPFRVDSIPFNEAGTTSAPSATRLYRLDVVIPFRLQALATYQGLSQVTIRLLNAQQAEVARPLAGEGVWLESDLTPGTWFVEVAASGTSYGDFQLVIADAGDTGCPRDINQDGRFDAADQLLLASYLAGNISALPGSDLNGDVNGGGIDATDLVELSLRFHQTH